MILTSRTLESEVFTVALTTSPPLPLPMKLIVVNEPTPTFIPSFRAKNPSVLAFGGAEIQRIPLASRDRKYPLSPGKLAESKIFLTIRIELPISSSCSGNVLPIPILPARDPVAKPTK